jgi:hypothetical protein
VRNAAFGRCLISLLEAWRAVEELAVRQGYYSRWGFVLLGHCYCHHEQPSMTSAEGYVSGCDCLECYLMWKAVKAPANQTIVVARPSLQIMNPARPAPL